MPIREDTTPRGWNILFLRIGSGLLALGAMGSQLVIHVPLGFNVVNFFSYFTNLSNAYVACVLILGGCHAIAPGVIPSPSDSVRAAAMSYLVIVGVVFGLLLRDEELGALRPWANVVLHMIMPCVVVVDWLVAPPRAKLSLRDVPPMLIPPTIYLAFVLVRGNRVGWYPYPFLNPSLPGGFSNVVVHIVAIAATFVFVAWLAVIGGNRLRSARDAVD
jgi:hypothetical protein